MKRYSLSLTDTSRLEPGRRVFDAFEPQDVVPRRRETLERKRKGLVCGQPLEEPPLAAGERVDEHCGHGRRCVDLIR